MIDSTHDSMIDATEMRNWLLQLVGELHSTQGIVEEEVASTLEMYLVSAYSESVIWMPSVEANLLYLGTLINKPDFFVEKRAYIKAHPNQLFYDSFPQGAGEWGLRFLKQILSELRKAICSKDSEYSKLKEEYKSHPKAFATAVATSALASLGVSGPMTLGIATFVLLILATATKNAFCKMTDEQALEAIREAAKSKDA